MIGKHVWKSRVAAGGAGVPGRLLLHPLRAVCGERTLELIEMQLEGRNRIAAEAFSNGQRITDNDILGE